jgi:hypothetical protein
MRGAIVFLLAGGALALAGCGGGKKNPTIPPEQNSAVMAITVERGKPVGGIKRATVQKGRQVSLVVHSDVADEVHLHGYDIMRDVVPGRPATIEFRATIVGTVKAELENRGLQIATITTKP